MSVRGDTIAWHGVTLTCQGKVIGYEAWHSVDGSLSVSWHDGAGYWTAQRLFPDGRLVYTCCSSGVEASGATKEEALELCDRYTEEVVREFAPWLFEG